MPGSLRIGACFAKITAIWQGALQRLQQVQEYVGYSIPSRGLVVSLLVGFGALIAAVMATSLIITGDPMRKLGDWLLFLLAFNVVYWAVGFLVFPKVIEDD